MSPNTAAALQEASRKRDYLRQRGVMAWALGGLNPNYRKFLAQLGRHASNQLLQRMPETRRYPILLAFLRQTLEDVTDEMVDLYDRYLAQAFHFLPSPLGETKGGSPAGASKRRTLF